MRIVKYFWTIGYFNSFQKTNMESKMAAKMVKMIENDK